MNDLLEKERKQTLELIKDLFEEGVQLMEATIDIDGKEALIKLQGFNSSLKDAISLIKYA